jgi:SSS family solute:Na+ symporter
MHCAFWGTGMGLLVAYVCRGIGIKDDEETLKRQAEVRAWLNDVDEPSESGKKWRSAMKIAGAGVVFLRHWPGLYSPTMRPPLPDFRPVVLADRLVDLGIVMMWALCFKAEMSTTNEVQIERPKRAMIVVKEA